MEQVQIADQTGELLGKTRVSRQLWPLVFCRTRTMPNPAHTMRRQRGVETTKVALAAASDSSSSEVKAVHRHKQVRIAVIHPQLRIGNVSLTHSSLLRIFARLDLTGGTCR